MSISSSPSQYGSVAGREKLPLVMSSGISDHEVRFVSHRWLFRATLLLGVVGLLLIAVAVIDPGANSLTIHQAKTLAELKKTLIGETDGSLEPQYAYPHVEPPPLSRTRAQRFPGFSLPQDMPILAKKEKKNDGDEVQTEGVVHYQVNLFDQPKVQEAFANIKDVLKDEAMRVCLGPEPNIDVFVDPAAVQGDLASPLGYNVFSLDCRGIHAGQYKLVGFVVVMDMFGNIVNVLDTRKTGVPEGLGMYNTTTVMFSTGTGVYHWDYAADRLVQLPFVADSHTLVYRQSDDKYFGLYADTAALELHAPQVAVSFDGRTGKTPREDPSVGGWSYYYPDSHFNYLTVGAGAAYCSARSPSALIKVDMAENRVEWQLGGANSDFRIFDTEGRPYPEAREIEKGEFEKFPWAHQHKFQFLGDGIFTLFDNNVGAEKQFRDMGGAQGESSRLVVLKVDEARREAREVWSYVLGDKARSYGGTELLPSGNVMGNSYPDWVRPAEADQRYMVNFWEVSPVTDAIAWRVGFRGLNLAAPEDRERPYPHYVNDPVNPDMPPVGWLVYANERFYAAPSVSAPCVEAREGGELDLRFVPYNTVRTQEDRPGRATLTDAGKKQAVSVLDFEFQRGWVARVQRVRVPVPWVGRPLALTVANEWGDRLELPVDTAALAACGPEREDGYRAFWVDDGQ